MRLDELARGATDSLLARTTIDPSSGLVDLKHSSRRRTIARTTAISVGLVAVLGGWLTGTGDDREPEPAQPVVGNGALLVTTDPGSFRSVDSGGQSLDLPDRNFPFYDPEFTGDGRELVYTSPDGRVVAHDVVTGEARELFDCGEAPGCFWAVSPDGQRLAVPVENGIEVHTPRDGRTELIRTPEPPGAYLDWSPDGTSLVYSAAGALYTVTADGTDARRIVRVSGTRFTFPQMEWSPDGTAIAFVESHPLEEPRTPQDVVEQSYVLRIVDRNGTSVGTAQDLGICACLGLTSPDIAWAPDGTGIAFTRVSRIWARGVHLLDLATGTPRRLTPDGNGFLVWQPISR